MNALARKLIIVSTLAMGATFSATPVLASGSYYGGSDIDSRYDQGKRDLYRKVICQKCPLPGHKLSSEKARQIIQTMNADASFASLSNSQRKSIAYYLTKRYKL